MGRRGSLVFFLLLAAGFFVAAWHEHGVACSNPPGSSCGTHSNSITFTALGAFFVCCALLYGGLVGPIREARRLAQTGKRASAVVLSARETGLTVNLARLVRFDLRVEPDDGPAFELRKRKLVPRSAVPRVGETVGIRYDPDDPSRFVFETG